jgi:hypothetical protein
MMNRESLFQLLFHIGSQACEISPTGPLLGPRMVVLTKAAGEIENIIIDPARIQTEITCR